MAESVLHTVWVFKSVAKGSVGCSVGGGAVLTSVDESLAIIHLSSSVSTESREQHGTELALFTCNNCTSGASRDILNVKT